MRGTRTRDPALPAENVDFGEAQRSRAAHEADANVARIDVLRGDDDRRVGVRRREAGEVPVREHRVRAAAARRVLDDEVAEAVPAAILAVVDVDARDLLRR